MAQDIQSPAPAQTGRAYEQSGTYFAIIRVIDRFTNVTGKAVACLTIPMIGGLVYEVFSRYMFHAPTLWAYDVTYMLYGTLFMLGAAYTLLKGGHIRTDMLYQGWSPKWQGRVDAFCYVVFFFPGMLFFFSAGWDYALHSWEIQEKAWGSAWGPPVYPFKTVIPVAAVLLLIQGVSELLKSLYAARRNEWL